MKQSYRAFDGEEFKQRLADQSILLTATRFLTAARSKRRLDFNIFQFINSGSFNSLKIFPSVLFLYNSVNFNNVKLFELTFSI